MVGFGVIVGIAIFGGVDGSWASVRGAKSRNFTARHVLQPGGVFREFHSTDGTSTIQMVRAAAAATSIVEESQGTVEGLIGTTKLVENPVAHHTVRAEEILREALLLFVNVRGVLLILAILLLSFLVCALARYCDHIEALDEEKTKFLKKPSTCASDFQPNVGSDQLDGGVGVGPTTRKKGLHRAFPSESFGNAKQKEETCWTRCVAVALAPFILPAVVLWRYMRSFLPSNWPPKTKQPDKAIL